MVLLAPKGAAAGFLPVPELALGWSLRQSKRCHSTEGEDNRTSELLCILILGVGVGTTQQKSSRLHSSVAQPRTGLNYFPRSSIRDGC